MLLFLLVLVVSVLLGIVAQSPESARLQLRVSVKEAGESGWGTSGHGDDRASVRWQRQPQPQPNDANRLVDLGHPSWKVIRRHLTMDMHRRHRRRD